MDELKELESLRRRLKTSVESVLLRMPHLNQLRRSLSFVVVSDRPDQGDGDQRRPEPKVISQQGRVKVTLSYLTGLSFDELSFLVAHEMIHEYYKHHSRGAGRNPRLWQMAADYEANTILKRAGFGLIEGALYSEAYAGMSAEAIYAQLNRSGNRGKGNRDQRAQRADAGACGSAGAPKHQWGSRAQPSRRRGPQDELLSVSVDELLRQREGEGGPHVSIQKRGYGVEQLEESLERHLSELSGSVNPWAALLRDFMRSRAHRAHSGRYRRRDIGRGLYLPSMRGDGLRLAVALDTSGSTINLLPAFIQEVEQVMRACPHFELTLIQCSASISAIEKFSHRALPLLSQVELKGGGGTSFQPVFDHLNSGLERPPNLLIYLTDGHGPQVTVAPNFPVIWVLSDGGSRPASFGVSLPLSPLEFTGQMA